MTSSPKALAVELRECPFCGGEAHMWGRPTRAATIEYDALCKSCGAATRAKTEAEAIAAWNRRAADLLDAQPTSEGGWKLVPVKPTVTMGNAGGKLRAAGALATEIYAAMLASSPTPPVVEQDSSSHHE